MKTREHKKQRTPVTASQLAELWGVSTRTVKRLLGNAGVEPRFQGRAARDGVCYASNEVEKFVNASKEGSGRGSWALGTKLLSLAHLAKAWELSPQTVRRVLSDGSVRTYALCRSQVDYGNGRSRYAGTVRFAEDDIEAFMERCCSRRTRGRRKPRHLGAQLFSILGLARILDTTPGRVRRRLLKEDVPVYLFSDRGRGIARYPVSSALETGGDSHSLAVEKLA